MIYATVLALALAQAGVVSADFEPKYYMEEWDGLCATGTKQSPINLPLNPKGLPGIPEDLLTSFHMPNPKDTTTYNTGHAMQEQWDTDTAFDMDDEDIFPMVAAGGSSITDILSTGAEPEFRVKMIPLQIHWHTVAEHSFGGMLPVAESHIVTYVGPGEAPESWDCDGFWSGEDPNYENCVAVFGTLYVANAEAEDPPYFDAVLDTLSPYPEGENSYSQDSFDLAAVLPEDKSYFSYIGSLTTPPCSEGIRWHVFSTPVEISLSTVTALEAAISHTTDEDTGETLNYRHNNRDVQPLNDRTVWYHNASGMSGKKEMGMDMPACPCGAYGDDVFGAY